MAWRRREVPTLGPEEGLPGGHRFNHPRRTGGTSAGIGVAALNHQAINPTRRDIVEREGAGTVLDLLFATGGGIAEVVELPAVDAVELEDDGGSHLTAV